MNTSDIATFHFLPPSIHLQPVHGALAAVLPSVGTTGPAGLIASAGTMVLHTVAVDRIFSLTLS
jgi:hypothetical protein